MTITFCLSISASSSGDTSSFADFVDFFFSFIPGTTNQHRRVKNYDYHKYKFAYIIYLKNFVYNKNARYLEIILPTNKKKYY